MDIVKRFGQQATIITASGLNLLVLFDAVEWTNEQVAGVNGFAALLWGVLFGAGVRDLNEVAGE